MSMNEINANRRLRIANKEKAEAEKIVMIKHAEAEAESKYLSGDGIARQRKAIIDGLKDSVTDFSSAVAGTNPKSVMELILITQYFDTLKDLTSARMSKVIFTGKGSTGSDLSSNIRDGIMQGNRA